MQNYPLNLQDACSTHTYYVWGASNGMASMTYTIPARCISDFTQGYIANNLHVRVRSVHLAVKCKRQNYGRAVATTWSLEPLWLDVATTDAVYETPALPSSGMCWPKILFTIRLLLTPVSIQTLQNRPWPIRPEGPALYKNKQTNKNCADNDSV